MNNSNHDGEPPDRIAAAALVILALVLVYIVVGAMLIVNGVWKL